MTEACATCGADDELLFTCRHCGRRFCERHELPHHACERFQGGRTPSGVAAAPGAGTEAVETAGEPPVQRTPTEAPPATRAPAAPAVSAPERSADTAAPGEAPVRQVDSQRAAGVVSPSADPQSLGEWLARQSYRTLLFKIGGLALLINVAFYGGVVLTLYDPFGVL